MFFVVFFFFCSWTSTTVRNFFLHSCTRDADQPALEVSAAPRRGGSPCGAPHPAGRSPEPTHSHGRNLGGEAPRSSRRQRSRRSVPRTSRFRCRAGPAARARAGPGREDFGAIRVKSRLTKKWSSTTMGILVSIQSCRGWGQQNDRASAAWRSARYRSGRPREG